MPAIIAAILAIISNTVGGITETQKLKIAAELQANQAITDLALAQLEVNKAEASNTNLFVAGWRPAIGWVCASAFAWEFLLQPMLSYIIVVSGHPLPPLPVLDSAQLNTVLMGLLGLGAMRSFDKAKGK